ADPTATVLSVALLLAHLGFADAAAQVEQAVAADIAERGTATRTTTEVGYALAAGVAAGTTRCADLPRPGRGGASAAPPEGLPSRREHHTHQHPPTRGGPNGRWEARQDPRT